MQDEALPLNMILEQVGRDKDLDARIDVYAVGVMLYRLLSSLRLQ